VKPAGSKARQNGIENEEAPTGASSFFIAGYTDITGLYLSRRIRAYIFLGREVL